jgi:hypothetical protein
VHPDEKQMKKIMRKQKLKDDMITGVDFVKLVFETAAMSIKAEIELKNPIKEPDSIRSICCSCSPNQSCNQNANFSMKKWLNSLVRVYLRPTE